MSETYTKLLSSITASTIWAEPLHVRIVWITMLAMVDKDGNVYASIPGLAHIARVSLETTEKALALFLAPDRYSRNKSNEGRRIEAIEGGWLLLNHQEIRGSDRAEYMRNLMKRKREKEKQDKLLAAQLAGVSKISTSDQIISDQNRAKQSESKALEQKQKPKSTRTGKQLVTFAQWIASIPEGDSAIPEDHSVFEYAKRAGLPSEYLKLAWTWFENRYEHDAKTYKDSRAVFRKSVEGAWGKLWWPVDSGGYRLSPAGIQLQRVEETKVQA